MEGIRAITQFGDNGTVFILRWDRKGRHLRYREVFRPGSAYFQYRGRREVKYSGDLDEFPFQNYHLKDYLWVPCPMETIDVHSYHTDGPRLMSSTEEIKLDHWASPLDLTLWGWEF